MPLERICTGCGLVAEMNPVWREVKKKWRLHTRCLCCNKLKLANKDEREALRNPPLPDVSRQADLFSE